MQFPLIIYSLLSLSPLIHTSKSNGNLQSLSMHGEPISILSVNDTTRQSFITGMLIDKTNIPVPYATVELIIVTDKNPVTKVISDEVGRFSLKHSHIGSARLRIRALGFKEYTTEDFLLEVNKSLSIPDIILERETETLDEVQVTASRPHISIKNDRITLDLENNIMASGASVLEVLSRAPGVYLTSDDQIRLNSKGGVLVTINGRQTYMSENDLATYLRSIPAESVKSIDLISNPPANFDVAGAGGVIDIQLRENTQRGVFGSISGSNRYNGRWGYTAAGNLNFMTSKWQGKIDANHNNVFMGMDLDVDRRFSGGSEQPSEMYAQYTRWDIRAKYSQLNGSLNYLLNEQHRIGASYEFFNTRRHDVRNANTNVTINDQIDPVSNVTTFAEESLPQNRNKFDFFYLGDLDTIGSSLNASLSYIKTNNNFLSSLTSNNNLDNEIEDADQNLLTENPIKYEVFASQVDLTKSFTAAGTLKAGLKYSVVKSDNNLRIQSLENNVWVPDTGISNHFLYDERISAAYLSYQTKISKSWDADIGLRVENTQMDGRSITTGEQNKRTYFDYFPSLSITQTISENYKVSYNFNRRITRPDYELLNPFVKFVDPFLVQTGYPGIRPSYANNFEINNVFKNDYQLTIYYSKLTDVFNVVLKQNDETKVTQVQILNLDNQTDWGLRANAPARITKWWNTSNSVTLSRTAFKSYIDESALDVRQTSYNIQSQHDFDTWGGIKLQVTASFVGPIVFGQFRQKPQQWVDFGLQRAFFDDKLHVSLNGTDVLRSQVANSNIVFANINTFNREYYSNQSILLSLRYTFSKGKEFNVDEREAADEEKNRMN